MASPKTKTFDALQMSRRLREETGRKLAAMTREQRLAVLNSHLRTPIEASPAEQNEADRSAVREEGPKH
jgi:hypothetical protein